MAHSHSLLRMVRRYCLASHAPYPGKDDPKDISIRPPWLKLYDEQPVEENNADWTLRMGRLLKVSKTISKRRAKWWTMKRGYKTLVAEDTGRTRRPCRRGRKGRGALISSNVNVRHIQSVPQELRSLAAASLPAQEPYTSTAESYDRDFPPLPSKLL